MEDVLAGVQREGTQQPGDEGDRVAALDDLKGFLKAVLKLRKPQGLSARKRAR